MPDHPILDNIAHDATELSDPPQRRLSMAILDNDRRRMEILPCVWEQLRRTAAASERRRWRLAAQRERWNDCEIPELMASISREVEQWLERTHERADGMFRKIEPTREESAHALHLADILPDNLFPAAIQANALDDKQMVAEAVIHRKQIFISQDRATIRHDALNEWLVRERWTDIEQIVQTQRQALTRIEAALGREEGESAIYQWTIAAAIPETDDGSDIEKVLGLIRAYKGAQMHYAAARAEQSLNLDPTPQATFDRIRAAFPLRSRATELDRILSVRKRIRESRSGDESGRPRGLNP